MDGLGRAATNSLGEKEGSGTAHLVAGIHHMVLSQETHPSSHPDVGFQSISWERNTAVQENKNNNFQVRV